MNGGRGVQGGRGGGSYGRRDGDVGVGGGGRDYHGGHPGGGRGVGHGVGRGRGPPPTYAPPQRPDYGGGNGSNPSHPRLPRPFNDFPYGYLPAYLPGAASIVEQLDYSVDQQDCPATQCQSVELLSETQNCTAI